MKASKSATTQLAPKILGSLAASVLIFAPAIASAQDSATIDAQGELVEAPATFSISGLSPVDFGQIALPRWEGAFVQCQYRVDDINANGTVSNTRPTYQPSNSRAYLAGEVTPDGCYAVGDMAAGHLQFTCTSQNVEFAFTPTDPAPRPEWTAELLNVINIPGVEGSQTIARDGVFVTGSGDVVAIGDPLTIDCGIEGAGTYDLYTGAIIRFTAIADTSTATLGPLSLGTLTVDAIY